jgi:ABC-type branched-subunit amino acid transport system ATPase component
MLDVRGIQAGYGEVQVLWDVSLQVEDREIVALLGSNGAGKTTLLRALSGIIPPSGGEIRWRGRNIVGLAPERIVGLGIAHVPEGRHLFAGLTVRENLQIGAHHRRDGQVQEDLDWVLELFPRLRELLPRVAGRLSGGEQQMCAIGRGLMSRPALIMIDEMSLGLAPNLTESLLDRLREVPDRGLSALLVEQDVDAALEVASRGYVMETGRIVAEGSSTELRGDPLIREAYLGVS